MTNMNHKKVVIIGSGPAAHTAAIYLARAEIKPTMYEGMLANGIAAGGQLTTTTEIENFPGFPDGMTGSELMDRMRAQSTKFGTEIITETIAKVDLSSRPFKLWTEFNEDGEPITTDAIVIATGASAKRLHIPGEETYWQQGISACEEAQFLTKYGSKVYLIVRKDHLRASTIMQRRAEQNDKIEILYNTVTLEAQGDGKLLNNLRIKNVKTNEETDLPVNGLFYAIGHTPATKIVEGQVETDETGYIKTIPGSSLTSVPGVFAAGDVQDSKYRQAITSAGSGCMAGLDAEKYLTELE